MSASKLQESEVRIGHSLHVNEEEFISRRRNIIQQCLQKLEIHCSEDKVPNIALLGSGGGQRAMVGLLGSLVQLDKAGLLNSILYLSGVSSSTWCMASLYEEPNWSTKLEAVKDKIIHRLSDPDEVSCRKFDKLKNYYKGKDLNLNPNFSLTDFWAAMVVTTYVKEIDEHTLTEEWNQESKDPFPIYTVIDKKSKQQQEADPWFEFTPHEAGYSLIGAFVGVSNFGSQFEKGFMTKKQPEIDMLYLQGLCGSALADGDENLREIRKHIWEKIEELLDYVKHNLKNILEETGKEDPNLTNGDKFFQVLLDLVDMNIDVLNGKDPSALDKHIKATLTELTEGKHQLIFPNGKLVVTDKEAAKQYMEEYNMDVCNNLLCLKSLKFNVWPFDVGISITKCMTQWIWGRKYNFLHNMTAKEVPAVLLESKTRDYEDAGLLLNSPYFSVLRKERNIDLIISLEFSEGDPFKSVTETAKKCRELNIPFPDVSIPSEDLEKPKDFYVFKGQNAPTVIHIPLFNVVNCGDKIDDWKKKYGTFQGPYSAEMINELMDIAGKNISNNKAKILEEICAIVGVSSGDSMCNII